MESDAAMVAALFAVDPTGTGGIVLRGPPGPGRDGWLALLRRLLPATVAMRRMPAAIADDRLLGGLDLAATLRAGRPVVEKGLLAATDGGVVVLAMAERLPAATAARLAVALDDGAIELARDGAAGSSPARIGIVALDEGIADDEQPPVALRDRLAFHLLVDPGTVAADPTAAAIAAARERLPSVTAGPEVLEALCGTALALGVVSLRASLLALRVARAAAALAGRDAAGDDDAVLAARLVLAPRATRLPAPESASPESPPEQPPESSPEQPAAGDLQDRAAADPPLEDIVLAAARAAIPPDLLARLGMDELRGGGGAGAGRGAPRNSRQRGRPIGCVRGDPRSGKRLHLVETLRAAAPWQPLRRAAPVPGGDRPAPLVAIRREDFRVRRFRDRAETVVIFVVDASGSSAMHRLAEVKGAVELLLADCYIRRDRVALLAFRGKRAELLLPPTRSLAQAKRCLAALPGGGGTPLATAIDYSAALALDLRRKGSTPMVVLLTDGRANISRDGTPGRERAGEDALAAATRFAGWGVATLLVDTAPYRQATAERLAQAMRAAYLPLPQAQAAAISDAVRRAA